MSSLQVTAFKQAVRPGACRRSRVVACKARLEFGRLPVQVGIAITAAGLIAGPALANGVTFAEPSNGASVSSPVHLSMSVDGMSVKPAAEGVIPGTGHFHVLIDAAEVPPEGEAIPFDDTHKHYGKGQTEVDVDLDKGKHKLTLQFANALHESYGPGYAKTITVDVK